MIKKIIRCFAALFIAILLSVSIVGCGDIGSGDSASISGSGE